MDANLHTSIDTGRVERLMKLCQVGVGGAGALDRAHDILAECYGTLGALVAERDRLLLAATRHRHGECVCVKCGLRQDAPPEVGLKAPFPF